ncbi:MAG: phosphoglycerate mutase family protein, partial [Woeseiaceae bacterium]
DRRRKRRRRRIQAIVIYTAIAVGLAWFFESQATTTMIFVRHAEKALMPVDDPGLSAEGELRAAELARQLVDADVVAGIDAIYSTSYRRTVETAQPIADALGIPINRYSPDDDDEDVVNAMVRDHKGKIILVVGHSNTVPALIAALGASKNVPPIAEMEYDNIYLISIPWFGKTKTIRMRYGTPYTGEPVGEHDAPVNMTK